MTSQYSFVWRFLLLLLFLGNLPLVADSTSTDGRKIRVFKSTNGFKGEEPSKEDIRKSLERHCRKKYTGTIFKETLDLQKRINSLEQKRNQWIKENIRENKELINLKKQIKILERTNIKESSIKESSPDRKKMKKDTIAKINKMKIARSELKRELENSAILQSYNEKIQIVKNSIKSQQAELLKDEPRCKDILISKN